MGDGCVNGASCLPVVGRLPEVVLLACCYCCCRCCSLQGPLPPQYSKLTDLQYVDLWYSGLSVHSVGVEGAHT